MYFKSSEHNCDKLIDLPDEAYDRVVSELITFLKPETKKSFQNYGYIYKRSSLLHGPPGTGKTCIVNRVASEVLKNDGIVLFNPDPRLVQRALEEISSLNPDTVVMIIFEELDQLTKMFEDKLLSLLDGEIQKDNVMYLATTNYIDQIPQRIKRPGRFSSVIEVGFPGEAARRTFLSHKLKNSEKLEEWVSKTNGLTIDEVSECIKSVCCLGYNLEDTVERIKKNDRQSSEEYDENQVWKRSEEMEMKDYQDRSIIKKLKNSI